MADAAGTIAYVGAAVGLLGGGVALFNARKAVQWKRAELANSYLKELTSNQELTFACRALDWNGGMLVVPDALRPLLKGGGSTIDHDPHVLRHAMESGLAVSQLLTDERLQIYRTAIDSLFSWLSLVASALDRNLFGPEDVRDVGYWVRLMKNAGFLEEFARDYGYVKSTRRLRAEFLVEGSHPEP